MGGVVRKLLKEVDVSRVRATLPPLLDNAIPLCEQRSSSSEITHAWMWPLLGQWLKERDVIITETFVPPSFLHFVYLSHSDYCSPLNLVELQTSVFQILGSLPVSLHYLRYSGDP